MERTKQNPNQPFGPKDLDRLRDGRSQRSELVQRLLATIDGLERDLIFAGLPNEVLHDATSERALLTLMFVHGQDDLCERLDVADFFDPWHRWVFAELRLAWEAGEPLDCGAAMVRWFRSGPCRQRAREAGVDENPSIVVVETFRGDFASLAHKEYLVRTLRTERIKRELAKILSKAAQFIEANPNEPLVAVRKLEQATAKIWGLVAEIMPEALECDE